ncbi:hypothetical protein COEREDRAFT_90042 [Coemansia reversa NRRL 1564]|uniref:Uncharacterized protein n=1 Tax=Coemansia reversa (strain ATCC 12441 / NRRL 1564) TaxID=763665 RepID=A0A2G5B1D9_COERN|nr:hypothetical protein COEREDRAFT_90042 [Coemansia reversa NRRL 1564]|eukprot:PIA12804.1 hypothetical protein COEREDRAFT_90042 [Coemansia reversa NRRL 1564]
MSSQIPTKKHYLVLLKLGTEIVDITAFRTTKDIEKVIRKLLENKYGSNINIQIENSGYPGDDNEWVKKVPENLLTRDKEYWYTAAVITPNCKTTTFLTTLDEEISTSSLENSNFLSNLNWNIKKTYESQNDSSDSNFDDQQTDEQRVEGLGIIL